jgi:hypothetical protein
MNKHHPFHPIIYVRGFAATMSEIEETVADPFMGFNIGSTKARRLDNGTLQRFYFESPLVRFFSEHEYDDVYDAGMDQIIDPRAAGGDIAYRCLVIHRYYDSSSQSFGDNKIQPIEEFAIALSNLIAQVRDKVCANPANEVTSEEFRCYLVAHSMGGLVCRAFLQNRKLDPADTARCVDKMFTYATPHGGIDLRIIGNVPGWGIFGDATNFNRERMAGYLGMPGAEDVSEVREFPAEHIFNLVGTNSTDYVVAHGISRWAAGEDSDGLVRIERATTHGYRKSFHTGEITDIQSPRAFVHRSHSGHYGIVNSEEGYQNLIRFLFGQLRVDGFLEIQELTLPEAVEQARANGARIRASYEFEVIVAVRGVEWHLHRRTVREHSAIFCTFDQLFPPPAANGEVPPARTPRLFSLFLDLTRRANLERRSISFAFDLAVMVPDYTINHVLKRDDHYEGGRMFQDRIIIEATPPADEGQMNDIGRWNITWGLQSQSPNAAPNPIDEFDPLPDEKGHGFSLQLPQYASPPSMRARLRVEVRHWNITPRETE